MLEPVWWLTKDGDADCLALYEKHYSAHRYADGRIRKLFCGPGDKVVLRTDDGAAFFVWRKFKDDCIDPRTGERQAGINCAAFRNEGAHQSSELVRQADAIADCLWPDRRHYTYVNAKAIKSTNPGYCFLQAGWSRCGLTKGGLIVLERVIEINKDADGNQRTGGEASPSTQSGAQEKETINSPLSRSGKAPA